MMKLEIELVPSTSWYKNLRDKYTPSEWQSIAKDIQKKANYTCEICGRKKPEQLKRLYCHELWNYNEDTSVQNLVGLQCLCFSCHSAKHIGYAQITDGIDYELIVDHFLLVNNCTEDEFMEAQEQAFKIWRERSEIEWTIDFGEWNCLVENNTSSENIRNEQIQQIYSYISNNKQATNKDIYEALFSDSSLIKSPFSKMATEARKKLKENHRKKIFN